MSFKNWMIFGFAVFSGAVSWIMLRNGVYGITDSWAYWEGSVSFIESKRYSYVNGGGTVLHWPPLFSLYLSVIQRMGTQTGSWLAIAMGILSGVNVITWGNFTRCLFDSQRETDDLSVKIAFTCAMVFVSVFVIVCSSFFLAHFLLLAILGLTFQLVLRVLASCCSEEYIIRSWYLFLALVLALLTHNSSVVFVMAVVVLIAMDRNHSVRTRAISTIILLSSGIPWILGRMLLGQTGSHSVRQPLYSFVEYVEQTIVGLGGLFLFAEIHLRFVRIVLGMIVIVGIGLLLVFRKRARLPMFADQTIRLITIAYLLTFALFNLTYIGSPISGRFMWFVQLALVPVMFSLAFRNRILVMCIAMIVLFGPSYRIASGLARGVIPPLSKDAARVSDLHIRSWYYLSDRHPERCPQNAIPVIPPTFWWMYRDSEKESVARSRRHVSVEYEIPKELMPR